MSAYVNFFIRVGDNFAPIGSFSRSSQIYRSFQVYAPWEKIKVVTPAELKYVYDELKDLRAEDENVIKVIDTKLEAVKSFENSVEDKLEIIEDLMADKREYQEYIDEYNDALSYIMCLNCIVDEGRNGEYYDGYKGIINPAAYLYVGIEIGCPTVVDIEG